MRRLIDLCGELGGKVLVHGSPAQRRLTLGDEGGARHRALDCFATVADAAQAAGVIYCIEALAPEDADFINRVGEAAAMVDIIKSPWVRTTLACCATAKLAEDSPAALIDRWLPSCHLAHVQVNDGNGRGRGRAAWRSGQFCRPCNGTAMTARWLLSPLNIFPTVQGRRPGPLAICAVSRRR